MTHHRSFQIWLILFTSTSSIMNQSTKRITRIFKASTSSIVFTIILTIMFTIVLMIITLSTNNIIANSTIIVTIANSWSILDLVIDFRFASLKNILYVINSIADRRIILKRNAMISKNALRIAISHENRVKDLSVVWNNLSLNSKTIKKKTLSLSFSRSWTSTSRSRSTISWLMNSSLNSTTNQNLF
jgi:hypothetical protein